jgi:ABC-type transport system involved in cytochrome c biogenesis ATPase subunit
LELQIVIDWTFVFQAIHKIPDDAPEGTAYLIRNSWDDYGYGTTFHFYIADNNRVMRPIGDVKIGKKGMLSTGAFGPTVFTELDDEFKQLGADYFSVGTDRSYYEELRDVVGPLEARRVLALLQDVAVNVSKLDEVLDEEVMQRSLLRSVPVSTIKEQFQRIVYGGESKQDFQLTYDLPSNDEGGIEPMEFSVTADSSPPSNVHVLIGSNGSGKTRTLRRILSAFDDPTRMNDPIVPVKISEDSRINSVVSVSFSAFDVFQDTARLPSPSSEFNWFRIGLERPVPLEEQDPPFVPGPMTTDELTATFEDVLNSCIATKRDERLANVLRFLEADPTLSRLQIAEIHGLKERLDFNSLSSGHKIVLLTLVSLVRYVEEQTLVLIDEPESHLHPPLLAAFTRALSWLLTDRNGLAIIATHSPVILQEVPRKCAWKIWTSGRETSISRPDVETFGENLGLLSREVFGLEIRQSGYHKLLADVAAKSETYEDALQTFGGQLGDEAKSILSLMISRNQKAASR